jgi:hypothetical protein
MAARNLPKRSVATLLVDSHPLENGIGVKLSRNLTGIVLGLLMVFLFVSRSMPRGWLYGDTIRVIGPVIGLLIVGVFVVALILGRSGRAKPQHPRRRRHH